MIEKNLFRIRNGDSMDRLESMAVIVAVAEAGSLSAVSRKLGRPIPTVSRNLSELEARLNA